MELRADLSFQDYDGDLSAFALDASRFAATFRDAISGSVPHIYLSALPFSPSISLMGKIFLPRLHHGFAILTGWSTDWAPICCVMGGHTSFITSIAFSHDGKRVVSGSDDNTVCIWDAETGQTVSGPFEGHTDRVPSVAFSHDGKRVVSGSYDNTVRIWDAETGQTVSGPFEGHTNAVTSVAFSHDGKRVVSGSDDHAVRIWDAETGQTVSGPFEGHTSFVTSVAFSHDGKRVVSS